MRLLFTDKYHPGRTDSKKKLTPELSFSKNYEKLLALSVRLRTLKETMRTDGIGKSRADYLLFDSLDVVCQFILSWIDLESDG